MSNKTPLDERNLDFVGGRVPVELQDELAELYRRGYRGTEIVKEGIRSCSAKEGQMDRVMKPVAEIKTTVSGAGT